MYIANPREALLQLTSQYTGERFADGRPRVSDDILERMKLVTTEEAWGVLRRNGYSLQFEGEWVRTHQDLSKELSMHMITPEVFLPISLISAGLFLPAYADYYEMEEVVSAFEADPNLATMGRSSLGEHVGARRRKSRRTSARSCALRSSRR